MIALALSALALLGGDLDALAKELKDPSEKTRREAVQALEKDGSKGAFELILGVLADPAPMVADEAQLALGKLSDPGLLKELAGKKGLGSGSDLVQRRAAEVFGRLPGTVDGGAVARQLTDKDAEVRRMLAWSLERCARRNALDKKTEPFVLSALSDALKREKDALARAAELVALGELQTLDAKDLVGDPAPEVACAGLQWIGEHAEAGIYDVCALLRFTAPVPVRNEIVLQLAARRSRRGVALLVDMLQKESNTRLAWTIAGELTALTGVRNERNAQAWADWLAKQPQDWTPPAAPASGERKKLEPGPDTGTAVFVGMPVLSDRVAILIDLSGSIYEKRGDGKTRKEVLEGELERTLKGFAKSVRFNLIPYTKDPLPMGKALVEATPANVEKALAWFRGLKDSGKGNVWDAFTLALADPEVDTLLLFSDGAPTGGQHWNLELMQTLFAERNRFRHVVLDAVIVDAKKPIQAHWKAMCEASGGRMLPVEMK